MKRLKQEKAITLIVLVITIIILLILAGITINLALGDDGIIKRATSVAKNYADAERKELEEYNEFENQLASILSGEKVEREPKPITKISIKESTTIERGKTERLEVTIEPPDADNKKLEWESSKPEVATVQDDGTVTAVAGGTTEITVKTTDGSEKSASCTVTVPMTVYDLKIGDYIKYDTGVAGVGENGVVMFRVLYPVDSEYGLQIISDKNVGEDIPLGDTSTWEKGKNAYNSAISKFNNEAEKYINSKYASDGRCLGTLPTIDGSGNFKEKNKGDQVENFMVPEGWKLPTGWSNRDTGCYGEINTYFDYDLAQLWKCSELFWTGEKYWLASRHVSSWESGRFAYFDIMYIDGTLQSDFLKAVCVGYIGSAGECSGYDGGTCGLRPCIALKYKEIEIESGDGKSESSAYTLKTNS